MRNLMKKVLVAVAVISGVNLINCSNVYAKESVECGPNAVATLDDNGVVTVSGTGEMYDSKIEFESLDPWNDDSINMYEVYIEEGITRVGAYSFQDDYENNYIRKVVLADSVKSIGKEAFSNTDVKEVFLNEGLEEIEDGAFESCYKLEKMDIPSTIKYIGNNAFDSSRLKSVIIPEDAEKIGEGAFAIYGLNATIYSKNVKIGDSAFYKANVIKCFRHSTADKYAKYDNIKTKYFTCKTFGKEHSFEIKSVVEPTCTKNGKTTYACSECFEEKTESIDAVGHDEDVEMIESTIKKNGYSKTVCNNCGKTLNKQIIYKISSVKTPKSFYKYTGKAIKPNIIVRDSRNKLISNKYCKVSYKNNKKVGKATVIVKFKDLYAGTVKKTFKIVK